MFIHAIWRIVLQFVNLHIKASQKRSSSSLSSDSVGSIIRQPETGKDIVGAWKPIKSSILSTFTFLKQSEQISSLCVDGIERVSEKTAVYIYMIMLYNTAINAQIIKDNIHRQRSSVNFGGGQDIFARKYALKFNKMPEFYMRFAWKINKIPEFYMIYARKN